MARIPYVIPQQTGAGTQALLEKLPHLNIFRMLAHSHAVLEGVAVMGHALLMQSQLDPVLREIAIIRVGVLRGSTYEVHQHERIGRQLGMSDTLLAAIHTDPGAAEFTERQRQVMHLTDDIVQNGRASDATFNPLSGQLAHGALLELVACIGFYTMISNLLNSFDVDIETTDAHPGVILPER